MKENSWKVSDIAGSEVFDADGRKLGVLADVLPGGNDIWVVVDAEGPGREIMIPALKSVVIDVDVSAKKIIVKLPEGLLDVYQQNEPEKKGSSED